MYRKRMLWIMNSSLRILFHLLVEARGISPSVILARCHVSPIIGHGSVYMLEVWIWGLRYRWSFHGSAKYLLQVFHMSKFGAGLVITKALSLFFASTVFTVTWGPSGSTRTIWLTSQSSTLNSYSSRSVYMA